MVNVSDEPSATAILFLAVAAVAEEIRRTNVATELQPLEAER